jgi:hypothetical protein
MPLYSPVSGTIDVRCQDRVGMAMTMKTTTNVTTSVNVNDDEDVVVEVSGNDTHV